MGIAAADYYWLAGYPSGHLNNIVPALDEIMITFRVVLEVECTVTQKNPPLEFL